MPGSDERMKEGKLPPEMLRRLLDSLHTAEDVLVGPSVGEDAAVVDVGGTIVVLKGDPITFPTDEVGWYALNVNANDVACMGARPRWFLAEILLPAMVGKETAENVFDSLERAAKRVDVVLCGGHTEITDAVIRPVVGGFLVGTLVTDRPLCKRDIRPGDAVVLVKGAGVEGVSIIARSAPDRVGEAFGEDFLRRAENFLYEPGIGVADIAVRLAGMEGVKAMHDPTEGGVATAVVEAVSAAGCGVEIDRGAVTVYDECRRLCDLFGLDPYGLISSGALLVFSREDVVADILSLCDGIGVPAARIGTVREDRRCVWRTPTGLEEIPVYHSDEIVRFFRKLEEESS